MNSSSDLPGPSPSVSVNYLPVVALIAGVVALGYWLQPERPLLSEWIGQDTKIQFRRDALGAARDLPISPDTGEINGASTSIIGRLVSVTDSEIVILRSKGKREARPHWIPREAILFHPSRSVTHVLWRRLAVSAVSQRPEVEKPLWCPHGINIPRRDVRFLPVLCEDL